MAEREQPIRSRYALIHEFSANSSRLLKVGQMYPLFGMKTEVEQDCGERF